MVGFNDIVITGVGCVTPIGIGSDAFLSSLLAGRCGVRELARPEGDEGPVFYGAPIDEFDGKNYVTPRKALKVMSREVQMAYAAAHLAWQDAELEGADLDPDRVGVVFGSEMIPCDHMDVASLVRTCSESGDYDSSRWGDLFSKHIYPLWMLKYLPNMPACHIGIAIDARGPNNTIAQDEVGGLLSLLEAISVIERDAADLVIVGGLGSRVTPTRMLFRAPEIYNTNQPDASRSISMPFDRRAGGVVPGEGAGAIVVERRSHAIRRGANVLGIVRGISSRCGSPISRYSGSSIAVGSSMQAALHRSQVSLQELNHYSAQGFSECSLDQSEAKAILENLDSVPVTAFSSYFGSAGAASGILELIASLLTVRDGSLLPTLGYEVGHADYPIQVQTARTSCARNCFLKSSFTPQGQAASVVIECVS